MNLYSSYIMIEPEKMIWVSFLLEVPKPRELSFRVEYLITLISVAIIDV